MSTLSTAIPLGLLLVAAARTAREHPSRGVLEFRRGEISKAMEFLPAEAEAGDRAAQTCLGLAWARGWGGLSQDPARAAGWLRKAAEKGDSVARTELGKMHRTGDGVALDFQEARRWLGLAAGQGYAPAHFELGEMCAVGDGAPPDPVAAAIHYRAAAEAGHELAALRLGWAYDLGAGVEQSLKEASRWYQAAARSGNAEAQCRLGRIAEAGKGLPHDFREAARWYRLAADQGHSEALWRLALLHRDGDGVVRDTTLSLALLELSLGEQKGGTAWARPTFDSLAWLSSLDRHEEAQRLARRLGASGRSPLGARIDAHLLEEAMGNTLRSPWLPDSLRPDRVGGNLR